MSAEALEWEKTQYSNYDRLKPEGAEEYLKNGGAIEHPAWDHWGEMTFKEGRFVEEVWWHGSIVATITDENLEGLFKKVNDEFGWD